MKVNKIPTPFFLLLVRAKKELKIIDPEILARYDYIITSIIVMGLSGSHKVQEFNAIIKLAKISLVRVWKANRHLLQMPLWIKTENELLARSSASSIHRVLMEILSKEEYTR